MEKELSRSEKVTKTRYDNNRAKEVLALWRNSNTGHRMKWQEKEQESVDFFLNAQLSDDEVEALENAGMPTFTINRITPVVETMKYFITANNPRWKSVGAEGADSKLARIDTDVIDYCWYISGGKAVQSSVVTNILTKSKGYYHIYVDPDDDNGLGEVKFESVNPFHVWTSNAKDPYERDATYQIIKKDLPREQLIDMLPKYEKQIKGASGDLEFSDMSNRDIDESDAVQEDELAGPLKSDGSDDDILPFFMVYEPIRVPYWNVIIKSDTTMREMSDVKEYIDNSISNFTNELSVGIIEKESEMNNAVARGEIIPERANLEMEKMKNSARELISNKRFEMENIAREKSVQSERSIMTDDEYNVLLKAKGVQVLGAVMFYKRKIKKTCTVGDKFLYDEVLDLTYSPLVSIPYIHTDTPCPMSAVRLAVGKQREINKSHQIMVHNANLSSNLRWMVERGTIDEEQWENYASSPGAILFWSMGPSGIGPREIMPQNINNAFFTIEQDSKSDIEYISGIHPPSMGIGQKGDDTYRGFLARDEYGTRRIKSWIMNVFEPGLEHLGKVFSEYAKDFYNIHKIFRIVEPNPGGNYNYRETEINVPIYDSKANEIGRWNDYQSSRYDLRIVSGSMLPISRWAVLAEYKEWFDAGIIDDIAFLRETDVDDKEGIINRKSRMAQLTNAIESLETELKDRDGLIQTLRRQVMQSEIMRNVMADDNERNKLTNEAKYANRLADEKLKLQMNTITNEE